MVENPNRPQVVQISLGLCLVTLGVFAGVQTHEFVHWDDTTFITENARVQAGLTGEGIRWALTKSLLDCPLAWLSHMLDCELFGLEAGAHHIINLFYHTLSVLLLFHVLRRMTGAIWPSALVAALFAWHPLHVESVAWVAERKDVLCGFFWMLTLWAYTAYAAAPSARRYGLMLACFTLGLMSKPMIVTLPFVLLLLDYWPLQRLSLEGNWRPRLVRLVVEKLPLLALTVVFSLGCYLMQERLGQLAPTPSPLGYRLSNAVVSYARYLWMTLWPVDLGMLYPLPAHWPAGQVAAAAGLLAALTGLVLHQARRCPWLPVGWFWYLGTLVPVIGLVQVGRQSLADRYTYLPLIGVFIMVAWSVPSVVAGWPRYRTWLRGGATLILVALAVTAWRQVGVWRDSQTLFEHALRVAPTASIARMNLALVYYHQGRVSEALTQFELALKLTPAVAHDSMSPVDHLARLGLVDDALRFAEIAFRHAPDRVATRFDLATALARQRRYLEAIPHYQHVVKLQPRDAEAHHFLAVAMAGTGSNELAVAHQRQAIALRPPYPEARCELAVALTALGRTNEAAAEFGEVLRHTDQEARALLPLARAKLAVGQAAEAVAHLREAVRRQPDSPPALRELAWVLATQEDPAIRQGAEALRLAAHASELTGYEQPRPLAALAAALAENGRFAEAEETAAKAIEQARARRLPELLPALYQQRLAFHERRPWREPRVSRP